MREGKEGVMCGRKGHREKKGPGEKGRDPGEGRDQRGKEGTMG